MPSSVWLGNPQPMQTLTLRDPLGNPGTDEHGHEIRVRVPAPDSSWTVADLSDGYPLDEFVRDVTGGVWAAHSDADKPTWVASDYPGLAQLLAYAFGCPVGPIPDGAYSALPAVEVHGAD